MLFKMSLRNVKRSMKDYAIYFFTLIIGVSVFYVFNAIGSQAAMMEMNQSTREIVKMLKSSISMTSVFVAVVLALLIVYASRFLMKRRHGEFAIYMSLGMSKWQVSKMLLTETVVIGGISLLVGLIFGIGLSQLMSVLVANLFEADMTAYQFTFSVEAAQKTVLYFVIMYLMVIVLNNVAVTKMKLIDLMRSGKKSETIHNKNLFVCFVVFILAAAALGCAYYQVGWNYTELNEAKMIASIITGMVSTFFIFWSVSGAILRLIMSMKNTYYRSIHAFTFRQISSMINTMVFAMTVICLMLFVTICAISSSFAVRNSMNHNLQALCPADVDVEIKDPDIKDTGKLYEKYGYDIGENMGEYVTFSTYRDKDFTIEDSFGELSDDIKKSVPFLQTGNKEEIVGISDYNHLRMLYHQKPLSLAKGQYIVLCNFQSMKTYRDAALKANTAIEVFGQKLSPKYKKCQNGFLQLSASRTNSGVVVVPDEVVKNQKSDVAYFIGNYITKDKTAIEKIEKQQKERFEKIMEKETDEKPLEYVYTTKTEVADSALGLGAVLAFLGIYIGLVFLVSSGAILSLKSLSECVDSVDRYGILRKIGVEEKDILGSLRTQLAIFFLLPLGLAIIHSIAGMKFATMFLESLGTWKMWNSIFVSGGILALVYGGYFIISYMSSKQIISES
ncbi:MAG: ABC transporter permease [Lachnospiraceae bacterium]|nr:ABC transporter permease [Lachnospiraceae bacterium]